ncbi:MAG: mechanosensitive ion channel family protein [Spirochaetales bacterium]|nr:mechanosensitive ion channel family protein [Spirochaetales bacterium]
MDSRFGRAGFLFFAFIFLFTIVPRDIPHAQEVIPETGAEESAASTGGDIISQLFSVFNHPLFTDFKVLHLFIVIVALLAAMLFGKMVSALFKGYITHLTQQGGRKKVVGSVLNAFRRPVVVLLWAGMIRVAGVFLEPQYLSAVLWLTDVGINFAVLLVIYDFAEVLEQILLERAKLPESSINEKIVPFLKKFIRVVAVLIVAIQVFQIVSGQSVTTIIAGFGIAGMAVALGAQDTIKNLFGFLMIMMDKPFQIGDEITFEGHEGKVESIGLRSMKMRRYDGHVVTIPNMQAVDRPIHNISNRPNIRRKIKIALPYNTKPEKIQKALTILKELFNNHEGCRPKFPPRIHFTELNADNLEVRVLYWYHPANYWAFCEHAEKINLAILTRFNKAGIEFAFPTQTVVITPSATKKTHKNT